MKDFNLKTDTKSIIGSVNELYDLMGGGIFGSIAVESEDLNRSALKVFRVSSNDTQAPNTNFYGNGLSFGIWDNTNLRRTMLLFSNQPGDDSSVYYRNFVPETENWTDWYRLCNVVFIDMRGILTSITIGEYALRRENMYSNLLDAIISKKMVLVLLNNELIVPNICNYTSAKIDGVTYTCISVELQYENSRNLVKTHIDIFDDTVIPQNLCNFYYSVKDVQTLNDYNSIPVN